MSGGRGDPLRAFATSGIVPGPHLDFVQFWDLRANIHGLCCVRWWAVPLLGHRTPGTGSHLRATGLCVVVGLALSCHRTAIREAFRSLYRGFSKSLHFVIPLQTNATRTPDSDSNATRRLKCYSDSGLGLWTRTLVPTTQPHQKSSRKHRPGMYTARSITPDACTAGPARSAARAATSPASRGPRSSNGRPHRVVVARSIRCLLNLFG